MSGDSCLDILDQYICLDDKIKLLKGKYKHMVDEVIFLTKEKNKIGLVLSTHMLQKKIDTISTSRDEVSRVIKQRKTPTVKSIRDTLLEILSQSNYKKFMEKALTKCKPANPILCRKRLLSCVV